MNDLPAYKNNPRIFRLKSATTSAFALIWLCSIIFGLRVLWVYDTKPGLTAQSSDQRPSSSAVLRWEGNAAILMFAHPHCPCTRASLAELARIMSHSPHSLSAWVLFYRPENSPSGWEKTDLYAQAKATPGVRAFTDVDGKEARRLHAMTSGHTLVYDVSGKLVFSGGVTSSRGNEGDNPGSEAIIARMSGCKNQITRTPVFGCSILNLESKEIWQ